MASSKTMQQPKELMTFKEASAWASKFLDREVSETNIAYLAQYGKVSRHNGGGSALVALDELQNYYESFHGKREIEWKQRLGDDLNWALSFDHLREKDTTKHVHRLHPYKGKFIPQLVQYFIDDHTDSFKQNVYFKPGDIILDPFAGSGTALVQAGEMGIHAIGVDVSSFNCMITETKLLSYDLKTLRDAVDEVLGTMAKFEGNSNVHAFEEELLAALADFNNKYFPSPEFKYQVHQKKIDERKYAAEREAEFLRHYQKLVEKYQISLKNPASKSFLDKWYIANVRREIDFAFEQIKKIEDAKIRRLMAVILSRTIRSCRATTHSDLATLKEPQITTYYCWKHKKICKPLFSIMGWFERYALDTIQRVRAYACLRTDAQYAIIAADSRNVDIIKEVSKRNKTLAEILSAQKIKGIFTSPPYVGQIDYHEQHAYAYDLFNFERKDDQEIGPLYKGQGVEARASYVEGITQVLRNCSKYMTKDFDVFIVANDKYNLYPVIAEKAGMKIVNQFKRPVLNRTERDKAPYAEIIFHLKSGE